MLSVVGLLSVGQGGKIADPDGYAEHKAACKELKKQCKADPACGWEEKGLPWWKYQACAYKDPPETLLRGDRRFPEREDEEGRGTAHGHGDADGVVRAPRRRASTRTAYGHSTSGARARHTSARASPATASRDDADCSICTWDGSWLTIKTTWARASRCQTGHTVEEYQCGKHVRGPGRLLVPSGGLPVSVPTDRPTNQPTDRPTDRLTTDDRHARRPTPTPPPPAPTQLVPDSRA